jgi:hypothetical protein
MTWTAEARAKAAATRLAKATSLQQAKQTEHDALAHAYGDPLIAPPFDWHHAPLDQAMAKLGDLRREYDAAARIVLDRQSQSRPRWICFTQLHKDIIPKSVQALCKKTGDDGKWASRDDGVFKVVDGLRVPDPQFCCSAVCHEYYLKSKPMAALSRH